MDIKQEIRRLVPDGALGLLGLERAGVEPAGDADLTVLFTDIEDSTSLTERLGDQVAHDLVRAHDRIVREVLAGARGREVKHTGDGIMASFRSASRALEAAVRIQQAAEVWSSAPQRPAPLSIAIGMNTGAPIAEDGDLFGTVVNVAARVTDLARGGEVLVPEVVRLLAAGKGFVFRSRGAWRLDGIRDEVPLFEVVWQEGRQEPERCAT